MFTLGKPEKRRDQLNGSGDLHFWNEGRREGEDQPTDSGDVHFQTEGREAEITRTRLCAKGVGEICLSG
jgi:hypothetical protein